MGKRHSNMGHSVHQFKALFWKNWLCRLRQPVLSLSEVLWPCILFLIVATIRIQQPPKHKENCYLEARDLPSRGLYPFVRSLVCNVGSRCKNSSSTAQKERSFRASSFQDGQDSFMEIDLGFLTEIQDFAKEISVTSEKAIALQKLWEEESKFSRSTNSSSFLTMDLNETEEMISAFESVHSQSYFWEFLSSLPWLRESSLYKEDGIHATAQFLQSIKNSLASLEDIDVIPLNPSFYRAVKIGLNITIAALHFLQDWRLEGSWYNFSLSDVVWDPHAVKVELESRFGLDDIHTEKLLNYTVELNKIPTEGTLEQFVCSALSSVSEFEASKEDNEGGCIPEWHEAKLYLVHSVNKIKLYRQIFQQWLNSSEPQKVLFELGGNLLDLMSQYPADREVWKIISAVKTLIQHLNENLEPNFPEKYSESHDVNQYLEKLQTGIQSLPQWPVMKRLLLVDQAIRNIIIQNLYFIKEIVHTLEKLTPLTRRDGLMHLDIEALFLELKQILISNISCTCEDLLTVFEKAVPLPQNSEVRNILAGFVCHPSYPNESFQISKQILSVKESVLLLQKALHGEQSLPDSVMEEYLGWPEIAQQLTETSAAYCKILQLLGAKTPPGKNINFRSCQEQLLLPLVIHTLEEIWFAFEENPYWKDVTTFVRRTCEITQYVNKEEGFTRGYSGDTEASLCSGPKLNLKAIIDNYLAFLQNLSNSPFISWDRIMTSVKELLKREKNLQVLEKEELVFILHFTEFIQEMLMPVFSANSSFLDLQSLKEIVLNNAIWWINSFANLEANKSAADVHIFSEITNELLENYQLLLQPQQNEQLEVFWLVKKVLYQLDHRMFGIPVEAEEMLEIFLSKIKIFTLQENQEVLNKRLQFFQKILSNWPGSPFLDLDYLNNFSETFIRNLYEFGVLTHKHFTSAVSTIRVMRNVFSVLLSDTTSVSKVQDVGKIVSDFYQSIPEAGDHNAASLVHMLLSVNQNINQLSTQSNGSVLMLFQKISKNISSAQMTLDFQDMSEAFGFLSETINLLQGLTRKPLCEKLATVYNYMELQAQSLLKKEKQEMKVIYSTMGSLKTLFIDPEFQTAAFHYLKQLFNISEESLLNNECANLHSPGLPSLRQSVNVHNSFVLPLVRALSNTSDITSEVNLPFAMHCTATWLQMWTEILENMSEILRLDLRFFSYLQNGLAHFSEGLKNITHAEMCNTTFIISAETTSAIRLLKIITEACNLNHWKDFATVSSFISKLNNITNVISSIQSKSLEEAFQTMENVTVKLQKSLLKVNISKEFLDSWFDVFFILSSKVENKEIPAYFIEHSLSDILTLSGEEFESVLTDLREIAGFLKNTSQDQYLLSCVTIFQNFTKLVLEDTLKEKNISQINVLSHLISLLNSDNVMNVAEGCKRWMHNISSLSEKYISYSHLENAKHVLLLLTSLESINETYTNLKDTLDIVNMIFNLKDLPCLLNCSDAHCVDLYFSMLSNILKIVPPTFSEKDGQLHDFIFTLLNVPRSQIQTVIKDLMRFSQYASDLERMYFAKLISRDINHSREIPNLPQNFQPSAVALLRGIQVFLKNVTSETPQNNSSSQDIVKLLNIFEAFPQDKNMSFLMNFFQHPISYFMSNLPDNMPSLQNISVHTLMKAVDLTVELVRKSLNIVKSYNLTNFQMRSEDKGLLKHMATLVKNIENTDLEFLIGQLKEDNKSLHQFFKNIKALNVESSVSDKLPGWLDYFENNSCSWNLTNLWQISQLFQEAELNDFFHVLYFIPDGFRLTEQLIHKNITDALIKVFMFTSTQEANMSIFTKEDLSSKVDSLLKLLEVVTDMPEESARALSCLSSVMCWNFTTVTSENDSALMTCNSHKHNFSFIYNTIANVLEQLNFTTPGGHALCSNEDYLKEITYRVTCFFHQFKEWNSILLKFSEIQNIDNLALTELLGFWNKLSLYPMAFENSSTNSVCCSSTLKRQVALQLMKALDNMTSTEMAMAKTIVEQLADLPGTLYLNRFTEMSVIKTILTHLKSMADGIVRVLDNEDVFSSFLSAAHTLLTQSPFGNQTYMVLTALTALSRNNSLIDNFEDLWLDAKGGIQDLLVNFSVKHLLSLVDNKVQLLSVAARQNSSLAIATLLKQFNSSSRETLLRSFEDFQEVVRDWLHEYTNKNLSRIINALVVLMVNEKSSDDIVLIIKDIIEFLELFRNGSKEDHIDISFVTDLLSGEKLNNVHVAHLILQNSLLNMISDLTAKKEVLRLNDTDLQTVDFTDLFFDEAQYENYGKEIAPYQSRVMEIIKEFLQIIFSSSTEHYRNKILVLLKNLHKDILAEMSIFPRDDIVTLLDQPINLKEEVEVFKENNIFSSFKDLIKDADISEAGTLHFDSAKGLKFMRNMFNVLFKDFSVKNGSSSRSNYQLLAFVNHLLFNANNSGDLVQLTKDLSRTLQLMRQTPADMGELMDVFVDNHFKDFLGIYPTLQEMVLANLTELLASVGKVFSFRNRPLTEATETVLDILWSNGANYTHNPLREMGVNLNSLLQENNEFVKLTKILEATVKFLTLSKKASERVVDIFESSINSNATENLDYIEVVYSALQRAVHNAFKELTTSDATEVLLSNSHQMTDLVKAFLDLTYLSIQVNHSSSYGSKTANLSTRWVTNQSKLNNLSDIAGEITEFLANVQNYSSELKRLAAVVTSASINSPNDTASLIEGLLDFYERIDDLISRLQVPSRLNFTHDSKNEEKWKTIQKMISYLCQRNITEGKASIRVAANLLLGPFCKHHLNENDLNLLLTYTDNQEEFRKVIKVVMESFKLMKNISEGSINLWSLFTRLINQNTTHQQKQQSIWETVTEDSLNRTHPWAELLHFSDNLERNFRKALLQTVMRLFAKGATEIADVAQLENNVLKMMHDFDLPFKHLSHEKYVRQLVNLTESWRQGSLREQRGSEMCQVFQKHLSPANALLLQKVQIVALNVLTVLSDKPTVISNLLCAFSSCKNVFVRHFILSAIEGINLVHDQYQDIETVASASNAGDCENFLYVNKKLFSTLESFQRALQYTTYRSCECQLTLEGIKKNMQMLAETLEAQLSGNPVVAFLSNLSLSNDVKIKDCMQNVTELVLELRSSVNISEDTIDTILESSISQSKAGEVLIHVYQQFLYSALEVVLAGRCDKEMLSLLLTLPANGKTSLAVKELCSLPALDLYTMIVLITKNLNLRNTIYKIMIPFEANKLLDVLLEVVSRIDSLLNKGQHVIENLPMFLQAFKSIELLDISAFQQVLQGRKSRSSTVGSLQSLIRAVCKEESSFFSDTNMFIDMPRITELLEDDMGKYSIPEDSTPFCLQLYQDILQSPNGALIWTFLKPLIHGKILYSPNSEEFNMVIEKANHTFAFVENLKIYSEGWLKVSKVLKNSENILMVNQLQEALQNSFIKNFIESHLHINVGELIGKLQVYEPKMETMLNISAIEQINLLAQLMVNISSCVLLDRFQPFESVEKLEVKAQELMQQNNFLASIIFNNSTNKRHRRDSAAHLPQNISYTIRTSVLYSMRTDLIKNPMWKSHPQNLPADGFKYNHIFAPLQDMIERAIIAIQTGTEASEPEIQVEAMPYPCHTSDLFLNNIGFFFPLIMTLTWMVSVAGMIRKLVYEKEIHLEEYMHTMGVNPAIHFLAWFLENVIVLTVSCCALVIILKVSGIFMYSNGFIVFLFLLDFGVAVVMLSYLLSAFFHSANTAALCASLVYIISFLPYIVLLVLQNQLSFATQTIACFLSTTAFGQGVYFITFFESQEIGIQWSNMYQPLVQGGSMTFGWACWMIFFDSIIYLLLGWYFSSVIPGRLGFRKPWYFPLTVSYWKMLCDTQRRRKHYLKSNMFFFNENFFEKGPLPQSEKSVIEEGNATGVTLISLTKEYTDNKKTAVKDLSLTFFKDQITALLGPNGAGKTTIISMLTGQSPPSSGTIIINGRDVHTELAAIRMELGVCPQYDVLFDTLTVREHLLFYGSVKAPLWTKKLLHQQVSRALKDVDLLEHQYKRIGVLSGGMKRRLSIAISFIGNPKTVILDEPTSGVDPCSRRSIWDILLNYRTGRTLIFTTHHLDEAEVLSDRIAILQHGQLRCCGPPSYLKEMHGQGYRLTLIKKPSVFEIQDLEYTIQITSLVRSHVPEVFLKESSGSELTYVIPANADKASFKGLFQALDENLEHLHVTGYGISDTTLEEVFLKLLQDPEQIPQVPLTVDLGLPPVNSPESTYQNCNSLMKTQTVRGASLVLKHVSALLMKRFHHTRRDWKGTLSNVLLPVLFVAMAMALFTVKPLAIDYPSLKLMPGLHDNAESFFFSTESDDLGNFSYVLLRHFADQDTPCTYSGSDVKNYSCWQTEPSPPQEFLDACGCVTDQGIWRLVFWCKKIPEQDGKWNKTYSKPLAKVWYNQKDFHSLPSYLNQLNNLILWVNLPPSVNWRQYGITLYSHPYGGALLDEDKIMENVRQCGVALCILLGFSILTASIGSSVVKDRVSGSKRLQHITGLGYKTYWVANFLYDMLFYLVPVGLCISVIAAFQLSAFTFRENLAATTLLLILFGYVTLPWMYLMSRFFSSSDIAFISYISLNFVFGLCTMLVTLLPRLLAVTSKAESFQNIYNILKWVFIVFPQFCLGQGLIELSYNQIKFDLTNSFGIDSYVSPFEMNFLGLIFLEMALQGTLVLLLRVLLHWDLLQKSRSHSSISSPVTLSEDRDVEVERKRLFGGRTQNDILLLYNLKKCYQGFNKRNTAVKDISLGIPRGECFGLLGANGAGKSTTFKMLTGDISPSGGRAVIRTSTGCEMDILSANSEGILIGYCPQQDALDELLTGWEHLYYYCNLRGVPKQYIHEVAGDLVSRLHLVDHVDKLVRTYSGGTKRKLSTALALIGKPQILLLDEPSSGMDPCSKRYLWKAIMKEVQDGCAAVLTSHSMEECEALCTRLAIMVNGSFRCLGSPQHIKNRFGEGYSVKVWLSKEPNYHSAVLDCLKLHFPGTQFKGQHHTLQEYWVPNIWGCLPELFKILEDHKVLLQIEHYSISQTTLEQVFINFAAQQQETSHSAQESSTNHHQSLPA